MVSGPGGRPTLYDPAYCGKVIEWGRAGKSKAWMAAEIGVAKSTLYLWEQTIPEFSEALARAMTFSQRWWEDAGQDGMEKNIFNSSIWSRSMAARFPDDWREVSRHEQTGANGGPIEAETKAVDEFTSRITRLAVRSAESE